MIAALDCHPGMCVLDVGSGSGYVSALLSTILGPTGMVHAVEFEDSLREGSRAVLGHFSEESNRAPVILARRRA